MPISSINFQKTKANSLDETTRQFEAKYLLKKEHRKQNEYYTYTDEKELFYIEVEKANRKGGRVPKLENSLWEAVVNLEEYHNLDDLKKVSEHIAEKFNIYPTRIAIHRDEGHLNSDGEVVYNYHAHLNFMTYKDGKQNWRRELIKREDLRDLQTEVAELLQMERGEFNSTSVRANHRHFRDKAEEIKEQRQSKKQLTKELAKQKDLQELNKLMREQLKEFGATRADYAELEKLNKELKEKIKSKDLTTSELATSFESLSNQLLNSKKENSHLSAVVELKEVEIQELKNKIADKDHKIEQLEKIVNDREQLINAFEEVKRQDTEQIDSLKNANKVLLAENETLKVDVYSNYFTDDTNTEKAKNKMMVEFFEKECEALENENETLKEKVETYKRYLQDIVSLLPDSIQDTIKKFSEIPNAVKRAFSELSIFKGITNKAEELNSKFDDDSLDEMREEVYQDLEKSKNITNKINRNK